MNHQKIALVTGASRGLGIVISKMLMEKGCKVLGVARSEDKLKQFQDEIGEKNFQYYTCDLSKPEGLPLLIDQIKSDGHHIDYLINNAGLERYDHFQNNSQWDVINIINTNLLAPMELTRLLLPEITNNGGHIVNIASLAGKKGIAYNTIYSATKAGLIMWSDGLRQELNETNANVTVICPGYISDTGMFHDGGVDAPTLLGTSPPEAVASAVWEAITKNRAEIIVNSGPIKPLLAIGQLFPRFGDRVVSWFGVPKLSKKRIVSR